MEMKPTVNVDFQNADVQGRVRLNTRGAEADISRLPTPVRDGLEVTLVDGELNSPGRLTFSEDENIWVAIVDWKEVKPQDEAG